MKKIIAIIALALACFTASAQQDKQARHNELVDMAYAFAQVESRNNPSAVNGNCVGWLQITPIMVREASRVLGYECFYLWDRYDQMGSFAIFKVIMEYHNKDLDLHRACEIWNKRGGEAYYDKVKAAYDELKPHKH